MPRFLSMIAALLAVSFPAFTQEGEDRQLEIFESADASLSDFLWVARPLVIFADAPADPRFSDQMALLLELPDELLARDVVIITDTDPAAKSAIRTELRPRGFMLALLAKDGSVVFRKPLPWDVREISRAIDKLPLRKQELLQERSG